MKILKIKFTQEEENHIFDSLIERFDLNNSDIFGRGQTIEFDLNELVSIESRLELYQEGYNETDTNAQIITCQTVCKFKINFFIDDEEVDVKLNNVVNESIVDKINNYYRI